MTSKARTDKIVRSEDEWRRLLTPVQFGILRKEGTEPAFQNEYWDNHEEGTYKCAGCGLPLFSSRDKFESGTGWPSFTRPLADDVVEFEPDNKFGMRRTAVKCARCDGHLGHVFDDGPPPARTRYCMNSGSLEFEPER
ncbi:MAG: peptide-methionine (R)-S-oxide reductase MsrB [Methanomassiliicoccus sp.]|nr:peptide-methionine (R)-S-oxide reductase MsrB [Methanomassiliicoccus sp.]